MIRNYFITAIRNLWRNRMITLINLIGMTIGFGIFVSLLDWVRYDLSYDRFHQKIDQIHVFKERLQMNGSEYTSDRSAGVYANLLKENFSMIENSCRVSQPMEFELGIAADSADRNAVMNYYSEKRVIAVDSTFFEIFSFPVLQGNPELILTERDHVVISKSLAKKLFGNSEAINKLVRFGEGGYYKVAGVVDDPPENSSIQFSAILGFHVMEQLGYPINGYDGTMYFTYFLIPQKNVTPEFNKAINELIAMNWESDLNPYFFLDKFSRMHLHGETRAIIGVIVSSIMSFLVLIIACINFINLTNAYSMTRLKEIFIRKSVGASKRQLIIQFLTETYLLLLLAFYMGLFVSEHLVPVINRSFGLSFDSGFKGLPYWTAIFCLYLLTGLIAGLYPAIKIAGFHPLSFLRGKPSKALSGGKRSRKVLIVVQFTFSIVLTVISIFIIRQYSYLKEADLGFNREDVLYIQTNGKSWENYELIKEEIKTLHFVEDVSSGSEIPVMINHGEIDWGERDQEHNKIARILWTDCDFTTTFDIDITRGSYYNKEYGKTNYEKVVVNEALIELMNWDDPLGKKLHIWDRELEIIGVTKNINFFPFNLEVFGGEALIYLYEGVREFIFVRVHPGITVEEIARIKAVFDTYNPGYEFIYDKVSEYRYDMLEGADGIKTIFKLFSGMAVFIAIMGLVGLSLFNTGRRTKEIGIRKVMGAQSGSIINLLLSEFLRLVLISNIIAIPTAYLILLKLLSIFNYRVELKPIVFIVVFATSIALSVLTVIYHALRIARTNPVYSLRYE